MTELDAFESIVVDLTPLAKNLNKEEIEQVRKSLKVLEIIKKQSFLFVEGGLLNCGICGDAEVFLDEDDFENKEEYELVKEFFENDK